LSIGPLRFSDRLVRDEGEFQRIVRYIETNPANAGLVAMPEEFPWSGGRPIFNRPQVVNLPREPAGGGPKGPAPRGPRDFQAGCTLLSGSKHLLEIQWNK
jgi:hypothetical protein